MGGRTVQGGLDMDKGSLHCGVWRWVGGVMQWVGWGCLVGCMVGPGDAWRTEV